MMKSSKRKAYKLGLWAESLAALYFMLKGYRIIERRYKTPVGEVDLIAAKGESLVFVEVKARSDFAMALESVNRKTQERIERAAQYYLSRNAACQDYEMRFDVVAFAGPFWFRHLDNAWRPRP